MTVTAAEIDRLDEELKKLRVAYEKYFAGVERIEPLRERDAFKKALRRAMTEEPTRNTALRFRLQTLQASLITYESYWNRVARKIEEGTYHRGPRVTRSTESPPPAGANQTRRDGGASRQKKAVEKLYEALLAARAKVGDTRPLTIEAVEKMVRKQAAAIKERYRCERVDFRVAIKDNRVVLKAVPRGGAAARDTRGR